MTLGIAIKKLTADSPEEQVAALIDQAKRTGRLPGSLLKLLEHSHPVYTNRGTNEAIRIRGYLLASFAHTGLPGRALPYVLEELDSSNNAYLIAGAAIALRGLAHPPAGIAAYLLRAVERLRCADNALSFATYKPHWPMASYTSALAELFKTMQWLKGNAADSLESLRTLYNDKQFSPQVRLEIGKAMNAIEKDPVHATDVCCTTPVIITSGRSVRKKELAKVRFQDQDGNAIGYNEFFCGKPAVAVLFYTRCNNPLRCSLNMARMGHLQQALQAHCLSGKINLAAITYDPAFDNAGRMQAYSKHRQFITDEHNRCLRVEEGTEILWRHLQPAVNYNGSLVNHHATEFWLLNAQGAIEKKFTGTQWDIQLLIKELNASLQQKKSRLSHAWSSFSSSLLSAMLVFFPKCPFCAAAYLSLLGITNLQFYQLKAWLIPIFALLLAVNLFALFRMGRRRMWQLPFYLSLSGAACVLLATFFSLPTAYMGIGLIIAGSLLNGLPKKMLLSLQPKLKLKA